MAEIRNPNQTGGGGAGAPGGSSSLLIYFVLTMVVFFGLQYWRGKHAPPPQQAGHSTSQSTPATAAVPPAAGGPAVGSTDKTTQASAVQAQAVHPVVVENSLYKITFSNRGGQVTSWILKKYRNLQTGKPLDLVNEAASAKYGDPLSLWTYQPALNAQLANALFVPSTTTGTLTVPATLTYTYASGGLQVTKSFSFDNSYVVRAHVSITENGAPVSAGLAWPAGFGDQETLPEYAGSNFDSSLNGSFEQTPWKKISGNATLHGNYAWAGVSDLYFTALFLPQQDHDDSFVTLHNGIDVPLNPKKPNGETRSAPVLGLAAMSTGGVIDARVFVGPKERSVLSAVTVPAGAPNLESVISFGWLTVIAKPLFLILLWIHEHIVRNWGWAILVLTLLLSLLTLPSRVMMMRSSLKMQRIQPQMDAIKARYSKYKATDPKRQEMNQEVFKLQKDNGVNMFGSCLPMIIQWPLLYAFYRMLSNVIELRQAHWLWIPDLSAPDPYHILPIFFIVSMFLVSFLTPSPGVDKQQQRTMAFMMPAVFGFMTWSIASGLALYWAASNVLGILTQLGINKSKMGREMREIALRRAAKKQGGKVINAKVVSARR